MKLESKKTPSVTLSSVTFSDGTKIAFSTGDVVVLVGPNNAGKSLSLREIKHKLTDDKGKAVVVRSIEFNRSGEADELNSWLMENSHVKERSGGDPQYMGLGYSVRKHTVNDRWSPEATDLGNLVEVFCRLLTAEERLQLAHPANNIKFSSEPPSHPIHYIYKDDGLANEVSRYFRKAFGQDLILNFAAGSEIPLHTGQAPLTNEKRDRVSSAYIEDLEKLPRLEKQGDGMRSFAGILLHAVLIRRSITLIDEPEAFLHPPQAKLLGQMLVKERSPQQQLFMATHSRDVLHGVLDANSPAVRVIRIQRDGDVNRVSELKNEDLKTLWSDPLLRYSNVLSGVFHEHVVLCESDADCRFYQAITDAIYEGVGDQKQPDVLFIHCGGKQRMPQIVRALHSLNVPISVTPDFDVLNAEYPLRAIVESIGAAWSQFEKHWKIIKSAVDRTKPELLSDDVKREVTKILDSVSEKNLPDEKADEIRDTLRRSSPWALLKKSGKAGLPSGDASAAYRQLDADLREVGIFVLPVGELERFCPSIGGHGPKWANQVLEKNLKSDSELEEARKFIRDIYGTMKPPRNEDETNGDAVVIETEDLSVTEAM
jgi:ABC-type transporter Mla maintaining outer membrane lipid asymmetry ATPase subunit MlaF